MNLLNALPEVPGFTVYDSETGEPINADIKADNVKYIIDEDGELRIAYCPPDESLKIPREGRYIVQLGSGEMFRY